MFELAEAAVDGAVGAGAAYADARVVATTAERLAARDGELESLRRGERVGVGVRALVGSSWGFFATAELSVAAARQAGQQAATIARASAAVPGPALTLADVGVHRGRYETPCAEPPLEVPTGDKADLLVGVTEAMTDAGADIGEGALAFWDTEKWFCSSQGHRLAQRVVESGGVIAATCVGDGETQRRSYPTSFGDYRTGGFEVVRAFDLPAHAPRLADEARALVTAPPCPEEVTTLVLAADQVALQVHESVGHATELDRILGWEAAYAGTSFLDLAELGRLRYGSELMTVTADATLPGALATCGYDDEGTPAGSVDLVREGLWVGALAGRDTAAVAGVPLAGAVRADGYDRLPMVRMINVGLAPGDSSLEEMVADTDRGVLMATNRSWSIDDRRLNFQFGCEIGWEIRHGRRTRMVRNPTYTGITPSFWAGLDRLGGPGELVPWGLPNCGKGQPGQVGHTAHPAVPARVRDVRVGVRG